MRTAAIPTARNNPATMPLVCAKSSVGNSNDRSSSIEGRQDITRTASREDSREDNPASNEKEQSVNSWSTVGQR